MMSTYTVIIRDDGRFLTASLTDGGLEIAWTEYPGRAYTYDSASEAEPVAEKLRGRGFQVNVSVIQLEWTRGAP